MGSHANFVRRMGKAKQRPRPLRRLRRALRRLRPMALQRLRKQRPRQEQVPKRHGQDESQGCGCLEEIQSATRWCYEILGHASTSMEGEACQSELFRGTRAETMYWSDLYQKALAKLDKAPDADAEDNEEQDTNTEDPATHAKVKKIKK